MGLFLVAPSQLCIGRVLIRHSILALNGPVWLVVNGPVFYSISVYFLMGHSLVCHLIAAFNDPAFSRFLLRLFIRPFSTAWTCQAGERPAVIPQRSGRTVSANEFCETRSVWMADDERPRTPQKCVLAPTDGWDSKCIVLPALLLRHAVRALRGAMWLYELGPSRCLMGAVLFDWR